MNVESLPKADSFGHRMPCQPCNHTSQTDQHRSLRCSREGELPGLINITAGFIGDLAHDKKINSGSAGRLRLPGATVLERRFDAGRLRQTLAAVGGLAALVAGFARIIWLRIMRWRGLAGRYDIGIGR